MKNMPFTAEEFAQACLSAGYDLEEVAKNPQPYLLGFINHREKERKEMMAIILQNRKKFLPESVKAE